MAHEAIIVELQNVRKHPNADRLQLATCLGYQVVVGLENNDGDVGVFFYPELQLSEEYTTANDLIRRKNPVTGENEGGMFDANRRVRSQKFRQEKSEGYWAPLSSLTSIEALKGCTFNVGDAFNELNGIPICCKYETIATKNARANSSRNAVRQNKCFPKHVETEKLAYGIKDILPGSIIYISEKMHGTSGRYAFVPDKKVHKRTWLEKILRKPAKTYYEYEFMIGTRNMILGRPDQKDSFYGKEAFRSNVVSHCPPLKKGEIIYGEIVGYTENNALIMGQHDTSELKEVKKQYGKFMEYTYGQAPGSAKFYVYRIVYVNEDGETVELSWPQVKRRAAELMLDTVDNCKINDFFLDGGLMEYVDDLLEGPSKYDSRHIREGVVLRVEGPDGSVNFYKQKSFTFGVLEGYIKQNQDYIDVEEIA